MENVILGAGISGIGAGYVLGPERSVIFEKNDTYGGHCNSFVIDGFTFDTAIHLSFTKDETVRSLFDSVPHLTHVPRPFNYYNGLRIKHPVQSNLYRLPVDFKIQAIKSFVERPVYEEVTNYREWLYSEYGQVIAEFFPIVYTRKYWCSEPEELSVGWIGNRMKVTDLGEVLLGAFTEETGHGYYADEMRYPKHGGYKAFLAPLADKCRIEYNKEAVLIDAGLKKVEFRDGTAAYYDTLFSSLPIDRLVQIIKDAPSDVANAAGKLRHTSLVLVSIGFDIPKVVDYLWAYIYDADVLASRVYSPNLKSPSNSPEGCSSLQMEIYYDRRSATSGAIPMAKVGSNVEHALGRMQVSPDNVRFVDLREEEYANVVFYVGMESDRECVRSYLKKCGIHSIGRYGEWEYLWSDQSLTSGMRAAKAALRGKPPFGT